MLQESCLFLHFLSNYHDINTNFLQLFLLKKIRKISGHFFSYANMEKFEIQNPISVTKEYKKILKTEFKLLYPTIYSKQPNEQPWKILWLLGGETEDRFWVSKNFQQSCLEFVESRVCRVQKLHVFSKWNYNG